MTLVYFGAKESNYFINWTWWIAYNFVLAALSAFVQLYCFNSALGVV